MIIDRPEQNKLVGLYRGKVLKHLEYGRLKVMIPGVYNSDWGSKPDLLPDAEQVTPLFGGGVYGNGVFSYPDIGAIVMCTFLNGDQNYPVVIGSTLGSDFARQKYVECAPELDPKTGKVPAYVHVVNVGKTKIKLYEGGQVEVIVSGTNGKAGLTMDTNGNMFIDCDDTLQVRAKNIKMMANEKQSFVSGKDTSILASDQVYMQADGVQLVATKKNVVLCGPEDKSGRCF